MSVTSASFRENFPMFADPSIYNDALVDMYLGLALVFQNAYRWDPNTFDYGTSLFTAHHLVLDARDNATANVPGGIAGSVQGVQSSKAVDKVSVSYDTSAVTLEDADYWNMTTYGIRFLRLARMYGAGPVQVGTGPSICWGPGFWG